jgi:FkbM family methyltransferase
MRRIDSKSGPTGRFVKKWHKFWLRLRQRLARNFEIIYEDSRFRLRCETEREVGRCLKFFLKEPGTCEWIRNEVKPGDIFYDIGANIGVFTLLAAQHTGEKGRVFAFEPHSPTFARLLDNIAMNNFQQIVVACNFALNDKDGFFPFNYSSCEAGTSDSQLSSVLGFSGVEFQPEISELKYAVSIDSLIASGEFAAPHHIKIDVDGNELPILRGMDKLLMGPEGPRTIQVEISKRSEAKVLPLMEAHNYVLTDKHYTRAVRRRIERGDDPAEYHYNGIFRRG